MMTPCAASGLPNAIRFFTRCDIDLECPLGEPDRAQAVVQPPGPQAPLADLEAAPFAQQHASSGTRTFSKSISQWPCGASS